MAGPPFALRSWEMAWQVAAPETRAVSCDVLLCGAEAGQDHTHLPLKKTKLDITIHTSSLRRHNPLLRTIMEAHHQSALEALTSLLRIMPVDGSSTVLFTPAIQH